MSGCSEKPETSWSGYAEADYVYVASALGGRLETLGVTAGQNVARGQLLFKLEAQAEAAARDESLARVQAARSQAANLDKGKRLEEVAVLQAQLAQARAAASMAQNEMTRQQQLVTQGFVSRARLEDAKSALDQANARVAELLASLKVADLPARVDERSASQAAAVAANEVLNQSQWRESQKSQASPEDALVSDVFYRVGEYVNAGQPVLALLPPQNIKARFFVPQAELASLKPGQAVLISCDGCGAPMAAQVTRIAAQAEYTPPVIYSNAQRSKLVFMVEAQADTVQAQRSLHPGLPLEVRLASPGSSK
jgi:HlyD family secretion protein